MTKDKFPIDVNSRISVCFRLPEGTGMWPAIWMLPTYNVYGGWPSSGEIDIMEHGPSTTGLNMVVSSVHTTLNNHAQNTAISSSASGGEVKLNVVPPSNV